MFKCRGKALEEIILLGIGGHAHSVVDSIEKGNMYKIAGFLDVKEKCDAFYREYSVIGTDEKLESLYQKGIRKAFVTVGYLGEGRVRNFLYGKLQEIGYEIPNIIDDTAILASDIKLGKGVYIGKKAVVNSNAVIEDMCIINTGVIIEHGCKIGKYTHVAVGATVCGEVTVGEQSLIGANSTIIQGISVGSECVVGAGTVITKSMQDKMVRYGNRERNK